MVYRVSEVEKKGRDRAFAAVIRSSKNLKEAAKRLDVSLRTVQRWMQRQGK